MFALRLTHRSAALTQALCCFLPRHMSSLPSPSAPPSVAAAPSSASAQPSSGSPVIDISDTEDNLLAAIPSRAAKQLDATPSTFELSPEAGVEAGAASGSSGAEDAGALYSLSSYHRDRRMIADQIKRLRDLDARALAMASGKDASLTSSAGLHLAESYEGTATRGAEPGLPIDYCVFCYHGTAILRPDNTSLLSKFVSERGAILPKRFTKCCPKHQRALTSVIKRARSLYLIPIHAKLHPQARFTSFSPPKPALKQASAVNMAHGPGKVFSAILLEELAKP